LGGDLEPFIKAYLVMKKTGQPAATGKDEPEE
jgi:hypothetical protein